jgi:hypothetical protein
MVGAEWTIPYSTPPGRHTIHIRWSWPEKTEQVLTATRYVTTENPHYGKTEDVEVTRLRKSLGPEKVIVLQRGRPIAGADYQGVADVALTWGGSEGQMTTRTTPRNRILGIGNLTVNRRSAYYGRGLIRFDLAPLEGKKIQQAWLRLTIRPNQPYRPSRLKQPLPVHPMLKPWKEGDGVTYVGRRGRGKGLPNFEYQAYPFKWELPLASGPSDCGEAEAELLPDKSGNLLPEAAADVTNLVRSWLSGKLTNYGMAIGKPAPKAMAATHPRDAPDGYAQLYDAGLVPFFSSDEPDDLDFRPRLVVVLE